MVTGITGKVYADVSALTYYSGVLTICCAGCSEESAVCVCVCFFFPSISGFFFLPSFSLSFFPPSPWCFCFGQSDDEQVGRRLNCAVELNYIVFVLSDCRLPLVIVCVFFFSVAAVCSEALNSYQVPGTWYMPRFDGGTIVSLPVRRSCLFLRFFFFFCDV